MHAFRKQSQNENANKEAFATASNQQEKDSIFETV